MVVGIVEMAFQYQKTGKLSVFPEVFEQFLHVVGIQTQQFVKLSRPKR